MEQSIGIKDGTLVLVTDNMLNIVMRFMRDNFAKDEPISAALGLDKESKDWEAIFMPSLKFNMSLAVVNQETRELMGVLVIGITTRDDQIDLSLFTDDKIRAVMEALEFLNEKGNIFNYYGVTEVISFKALSVRSYYRRYGIGSFLVNTGVRFIKNFGLDQICIVTEVTSAFSKICTDRCGFEEIYALNYDQYMKDGVQVICGTGIHKTMSLCGMKMSSAKSKL